MGVIWSFVGATPLIERRLPGAKDERADLARAPARVHQRAL